MSSSPTKRVLAIKHHLLGVLAVTLTVGAVAAPPTNEKVALTVEIARLVNNLHWRQMISTSLQRGDTQAPAKRAISLTEEQRACVDREYTEDAVLALIVASYEKVYSTSQVVAEVNGFVESTGGQKILATVAEQTKQVGARAAGEKLKPELVLTPQEKKYFELFAASTAGREYLEARRRLPTIQRELFAQFAVSVQSKCGIRTE